MTGVKLPRLNRRRLIAALLLALPAYGFLSRIRPTRHDDIVEVDGWILKRSDLT